MKIRLTHLQKAIPFFLLFLITFSVQGQPPPPGYNYEETAGGKQSVVVKGNSNGISAKGPNQNESGARLKESTLDKIYKTFLSIKDNLTLSKSEKAKIDANELVTLVTENMEHSVGDAALLNQIKRNVKMICDTDDLNEQRQYLYLISENMQQLLDVQ